MSSAALLRKKILTILQEKILPDLQSNGARQLVMAHLPLHVPDGITVRELLDPPLVETDADKVYPGGRKWTSSRMHVTHCTTLHCVIDGEADLTMGVLADKSTFNDQPGGYIFSLQGPAYFLVPPGVPQKVKLPWQREESHVGKTNFLVIRVLPIGIFCNLAQMDGDAYSVEYSLYVKDAQMAAAAALLVDELANPPANSQIAGAQLLTIILRLTRGLNKELPAMIDGLFSRFPDDDSAEITAPLRHEYTVRRIDEYIHLHLDEALSPDEIAQHMRITADHLNRIIKAHVGLTTMNYVKHQRMGVAQLLLADSDLSVQEISRLVGYKQFAHFSRSFHRHTGLAPLKYRQRKSSS